MRPGLSVPQRSSSGRSAGDLPQYGPSSPHAPAGAKTAGDSCVKWKFLEAKLATGELTPTAATSQADAITAEAEEAAATNAKWNRLATTIDNWKVDLGSRPPCHPTTCRSWLNATRCRRRA